MHNLICLLNTKSLNNPAQLYRLLNKYKNCEDLCNLTIYLMLSSCKYALLQSSIKNIDCLSNASVNIQDDFYSVYRVVAGWYETTI